MRDKLAIVNRDATSSKAKINADFRLHTKFVKFNVSDRVLVKRKQLNKQMSVFDPYPLIVTEVKGTKITA